MHAGLAYQNQSITHLLIWENLLLHVVQSYKSTSNCSKPVKKRSTQGVLVFWIIADRQKLQYVKPTWSVQSELLRLKPLSTRAKRSEALQIHRGAAKTIAAHEYKEDCFELDSSESDYSKNSDIQKIPHHYDVVVFSRRKLAEKCFRRKDFHMVMVTVVHDVMERYWAKTATILPIANKNSIE